MTYDVAILLKALFPALYSIVNSTDAWMVQFWDEVGGVGHWSPCFFRNVQDWEVDMVEDFLKKI